MPPLAGSDVSLGGGSGVGGDVSEWSSSAADSQCV